MKTLPFTLLAASLITVAIIVSHRSAAQPANLEEAPGSPGEFAQLVLALSKNADTNTVKQLTDLVTHIHVQESATEAGFDTRILNDLRSGKNNEAMELLEVRLDGAVTGFASPLIGKRYPQYDKILEYVKKYRAKYPHSSKDPQIDADVAGALESLPKR